MNEELLKKDEKNSRKKHGIQERAMSSVNHSKGNCPKQSKAVSKPTTVKTGEGYFKRGRDRYS